MSKLVKKIAYFISGKNRKRKFAIFMDNMQPTPSTTILDVGYSDNEYSVTDNYLEKHYPYRASITALGIDKPNHFKKRYPDVTVLQYDGRTFPFADNSFDIVYSNATIEHVGNRDQQLYFLNEMKRVAKKGVFFTTPNKLFPIEVHTRTPLLHFLPKVYFDRYLLKVKKAWATGDYMHLLSLGDLRGILNDAGVSTYKIIKNRLCGFVLDFIVTWQVTQK